MREVLLVHGLWHGAWAWDAVAAGLRDRGVPVRALDLPMRTLDGDAAVVRDALDTAAGPVVLAGHSYGGAVITAAGDHPAVGRLVYLAAFALTETESISRVAPGEYTRPSDGPDPAAGMFVVDGEDVHMNAELAADVLYPGNQAAAAEAARRVRPVGRALFSARPPAAAWRTRPATYVVCADDRMVDPALQRIMAARCATVLEWPGDHSPQVSRPGDVVELLATHARAHGTPTS